MCVCVCRWLSEQSEALPSASNLSKDHTVALLLSVCESDCICLLFAQYAICFSDSNNSEVSTKLLNILIEAVAPSSPGSMPDLCMLPLRSLSTIAMHAKIRSCDGHPLCCLYHVSFPPFRLMDKVKHHLVQVAEASKQLPAGQPPTITPALLETYSRLLIWLGTRNFQSQWLVSFSCFLVKTAYQRMFSGLPIYNRSQTPHI